MNPLLIRGRNHKENQARMKFSLSSGRLASVTLRIEPGGSQMQEKKNPKQGKAKIKYCIKIKAKSCLIGVKAPVSYWLMQFL